MRSIYSAACAAVFGVATLACGGARTEQTTAPRTRDDRADAAAAEIVRPDWPDTPLTPLAEDLATVALAAATGGPLPESAVPRPDAIARAAAFEEGARPSGALVPLALIARFSAIDPSAPDRAHLVTVALGAPGLAVLQLESRAPITAPERPPLAANDPLRAPMDAILASLRDGSLPPFATDTFRESLGNDGVAALSTMVARVPAPDRGQLSAGAVAALPIEVAVLARDPDGALFTLDLRLIAGASGAALDGDPLADVSQIPTLSRNDSDGDGR